MRIELDGRQMTGRAAAHTYLKEQLGLPEYYGRNLDALYDLLTEHAQPRTLVLRHADALEAQLGDYAGALLETLRDAAEGNHQLTLVVE